jgi:hypothetical protein
MRRELKLEEELIKSFVVVIGLLYQAQGEALRSYV